MTASSPFPSKQDSSSTTPSESVVDIDVVAVDAEASVPDVVPSVLDSAKVAQHPVESHIDVSIDSAQVIDVNVDPSQAVTITVEPRANNQANQPKADEEVVQVEAKAQQADAPSPGGALAAVAGSFSSYLAPLSKDKFAEVVRDVEERLKVVNNTLSMMDSLVDSEGFDAILSEMLQSISLKTGELLNAHRTTIYLLDEDKNELWAILAKDDGGNSLELRFP